MDGSVVAMRLVPALVSAIPAALVLAQPVTGRAACTDNSFFPLQVGTTRTYESQKTHQRSALTVTTVDQTNSLVTAQGTITSPGGVTIPLPDQFTMGGHWTHSFKVVTQNGPIGTTMDTTETHTVVAVNDLVHVPAAPASGWHAFKIQVVSTSTFAGMTGLPPSVHMPTIPPGTSTTFEWIVRNVGLVQSGSASGQFNQLVDCGTSACPAAP